jgi:hypothetical protein
VTIIESTPPLHGSGSLSLSTLWWCPRAGCCLRTGARKSLTSRARVRDDRVAQLDIGERASVGRLFFWRSGAGGGTPALLSPCRPQQARASQVSLSEIPLRPFSAVSDLPPHWASVLHANAGHKTLGGIEWPRRLCSLRSPAWCQPEVEVVQDPKRFDIASPIERALALQPT